MAASGLTQPSPVVCESPVYLFFSCFGFDGMRGRGCGLSVCEKGQMRLCHAKCVEVGHLLLQTIVRLMLASITVVLHVYDMSHFSIVQSS